MPADIIPFPAPVVHLKMDQPAAAEPKHGLLAVEHDGRVYSLAALLARLPSDVLDELDNLVPRSSQETWDLVVRRWPHLAGAVIGSRP